MGVNPLEIPNYRKAERRKARICKKFRPWKCNSFCGHEAHTETETEMETHKHRPDVFGFGERFEEDATRTVDLSFGWTL